MGRRRLPRQRARLLGRDVRADLPRRLGRPARAAGPADPALRPPADAVDRLLLAPPGGRDHLAAHQRRAGARPARLRRRGDAVRLHAHARRHRRHPAGARRRARAADVPRVPAAGARVAGVPDRLRQRLPGHAREGRGHHRVPAGDALRRARGAQLRPGAAPPRPLRRAQRGQLRGQHEDRPPQRRLLPGGRAAVRGRHRRDPALRRPAGGRRRDHDRRAGGLHRRARQLLRPDPVAVAVLHDLPGGDGGARQDLRAARRGARPARPAGRGPARPPAGRDRLRRRHVLLRLRRRAVPRRPARAARADGRARGRDRRRQVDVRQARGALLRPDRGPRAGRRPRPARRRRPLAALPDGDRAAGGVPVQRLDRRQHRVRAPGRDTRGRRGRRARRARRTTSSERSSTATTRRSASAGSSSRPGSASSWRSPAR